MLKESIRMSWENIRDNKMRSFLTTLGILIGVAAIIALITILTGITDEVNRKFLEMGTSNLSIYATGTPLKRGLTDAELQKLEAVDNVSGISPTVSLRSAAATAEKGVVEPIAIEGRNEVFFDNATSLTLAEGRTLSAQDVAQKNRVCVINDDLRQKLFPYQSPLGQTIHLEGQAYTVVGYFAPEDVEGMDAAFSAMMGQEKAEGTAYIPYKNALDMSGAAKVTVLDVYMVDSMHSAQTIADLKGVLNAAVNYKDDSYTIINMESLLDALQTFQNMLAGLLAGIAGISLLVGGIGIMNMMLVSVTERTKEIGLRKALGAKPRQIQMQFIIESIFLSLLGGVFGLILGIAIAALADNIINVPFTLSEGAIVLGLGFSTAVGIIFGWTPAKRASELNPIDALRTE